MVTGTIISADIPRGKVQKNDSHILLHIRTDDKELVTKKVPFKYTIPSHPINYEPSFFAALNFKKINNAGIEIKEALHTEDGTVFHARVPIAVPKKDLTSLLGARFQTKHHLVSAARQATWAFGIPFQQVILEDDQIRFTGKKQSLENLVNQPIGAFDIELEDWKKIELEDEIFAYSDEKLKELFEELRIQADIGMPPQYRLWQRKHFLRAILNAVDSFRVEKVLTAGYVSLLPDNTVDSTKLVSLYPILRDIKVDMDGIKNPSVAGKIFVEDQEEMGMVFTDIIHNNNPPIIATQNGRNFDYRKFIELTKKFFPGINTTAPKYWAYMGFNYRYTIPGRLDLDPYGYSQHYSWTPRNRLDYLCSYILGLDVEKSIPDYSKLITLTKRLEQGDQEAGYEIGYYQIQDCLKTVLLARYLAPEVFSIARMLGVSPSEIETTSKKRLAMNRFMRSYSEKTRTFLNLSRDDMVAWSGTKTKDGFKLPTSYGMKLGRSKPGFHNAIIIQPTYIAKILKPFMPADTSEIDQLMEETDDPKRKVRLGRALHSLAEWMIFRYSSLDEKNRQKQLSKEWTGNPNIESVIEGIEKSADYMKETFDGSIINNSQLFMVVDETQESYAKKLEKEGLCTILTKARVLSLGKGKFAFYDGHDMLSQGVDPFGTKGEKCGFETRNIETFLQYALVDNDLKKALEYISEQAKIFQRGDLAEEELTYKREARRAWNQFNARARASFIKEMISQQAEKGDIIRYKKLKVEMEDKMYRLSSGEYSQGSISRWVKAVFPSRKKETKEALNDIFSGRGSEDDIRTLMSQYEI